MSYSISMGAFILGIIAAASAEAGQPGHYSILPADGLSIEYPADRHC